MSESEKYNECDQGIDVLKLSAEDVVELEQVTKVIPFITSQ